MTCLLNNLINNSRYQSYFNSHSVQIMYNIVKLHLIIMETFVQNMHSTVNLSMEIFSQINNIKKVFIIIILIITFILK
jgi:hypothetical protein